MATTAIVVASAVVSGNGRGREMTDPNGAVVGVGGSGEAQTGSGNQRVVDPNFHVDAFADSAGS